MLLFDVNVNICILFIKIIPHIKSIITQMCSQPCFCNYFNFKKMKLFFHVHQTKIPI